jgi:hypothetical protein
MEKELDFYSRVTHKHRTTTPAVMTLGVMGSANSERCWSLNYNTEKGPYGPFSASCCTSSAATGGGLQTVWGTGGRKFESRRSDQFPK